MELDLLGDIVIIFGLSVVVILLFHKMRAPAVVGFLVTGMLAGPHGLGLIKALEQVNVIAEIGVILLLFAIGIEVSLKEMLKIKKFVLAGGFLQVALTSLAVFVLLDLIGVQPGSSILIGFLISLSSTAIVLRIIQSRAEVDSLYGRTTLGILIFQDLAIVPMMLVTPLLPGVVNGVTDSPLGIVSKSIALVLIVLVSAKWIVPKALYQVARTGDRELFLLCLIAICFAVAWSSYLAGLSLGLGAFLAGLTVSESPYSQHAFGNILPLKDAFSSFFFVSIGMLMDSGFLLERPGYIIMLALAVMALKALIAGSVTLFIGLPLRIAILVGLALSQIGEFSFVLSKVGLESGLLSSETYQIFLDISVLTMGATSFIMALSPRIADSVQNLPLPKKLRSGAAPESVQSKGLKDHLIIVGYGVNGRNVARSAEFEGIAYEIIEMDPEIVKVERARGEPISYGDATQANVLIHAGIKEARVMVIAISDPWATRRITGVSKHLNPDLYIIARTRYIQEMKPLHDLGANQVIPEEYETSVEIFYRVLEKYQVPRDRIESFVEQIRADGYEMFRSLSNEPYCKADLNLISNDLVTLKVAESSPACGRSIAEMGLETYGIAFLAIHRGSETLNYPDENTKFLPGDVVVLLGQKPQIDQIEGLFKDTAS